MGQLESGMLFIKEPQHEICELEKTELYKRLSNSGVKTVEYIRARKIEDDRHVLTWIEAKTTFPDPQTERNFAGEINAIAVKFARSLEMFAAVMMNKLPDNESEFEKFRQIYEKAQFRMILVIKEHQKEWLWAVTDALHQRLKPHWKIWNLNPSKDILVLNEELAIRHQLIQQLNI